MRGDRLVSLLILLQTGRRWTAAALAERLEVSERTVHRDLDALSASGIPVLATRGATGGVALAEGWRTQLTGLNRSELHALASMGEPRALADLDLLVPLRSGMGKLAVSLPAVQRTVMEYARQRLHVDAAAFFGEREPVPHLARLREAVWQDRRLRLRYRDFDGRRTSRTVDPYALVVKADRWYLVAGTSRGPTVFRGARIEGATLLDETFERPAGFDLPAFWREWCTRFAERRASFEVELRIGPEAEESLRGMRPPADQERLSRAPAGDDGRKAVTIDFERESIAVSQLCLLGGGAEVIAPAALRERLRHLGDELRSLYDAGAPRRR